MRPGPETQPDSIQEVNASSHSLRRVCRFAALSLIAVFVPASLAFFAGALPAQQAQNPQIPATQAPTPKTPALANPRSGKSTHSHAKAASQPAPQPVPEVSVTAPVPLPPDWPANDHPSEANVTWDSTGLRIVAANSSLSQIMKAIAAETGATVQGMAQDQRIFGIYGPGRARDVIAQLLDGSGYNVLMMGDLGQGTPRQIVLTSQAPGGPQPPGAGNPGPANEEDTEAEQEPQPEPEPPPQQQPPNGAAPAVPVRTQQQIMQELRDRQQQIQQQQPQNQ
jgi:hypothetical protein